MYVGPNLYDGAIFAVKLINYFRKKFHHRWKKEKEETLAHVFSCEFWEIFKNTFLTEHLWTAASRCNIAKVNIVSIMGF